MSVCVCVIAGWNKISNLVFNHKMNVPRKLIPHVGLFLGFLVMFFEASEYVDFFNKIVPLPHYVLIVWGFRIVFLVASFWYGRKAYLILNDPNNYDRR